MKKITNNILLCVALIVSVCSCNYDDFNPSEWAVEPELSLSSSYIVFNSAIGTQTISVTTNYESFTVETSEDWCHVTTDMDSSRVEIEVDPNNSTDQRIATVRVKVARGNKSLVQDISVIQWGGVWDTVGNFNVFWRQELSDGQKEAIVQLLESLQYVEGGTFTMGSDEDAHQVTLSTYYIGKFEVTQKQWSALMAENNSEYRGSDLPVENISWAQALEYVNLLAEITNLDIALPTEAQWEYAARGGKYSAGYTYPGSDDYTEVAHYVNSSIDESNPLFTTAVGGTKLPNELGLYDMAGNVSEFCYDWYGDYSDITTNENPTGVDTGTLKVRRGGDMSDPYAFYDVSYRFWGSASSKQELTGFRIVLNL